MSNKRLIMAGKRIILLPGDVRFAQAPDQLCTLLGSCLAITAWHPQRQLGGMCHFLLPQAHRPSAPDGRYGSDAFKLLCQLMQQHASAPDQYHYQIYGGSQILQPNSKESSIGSRNIKAAKQLLLNASLNIEYEDTGGGYSRKVILDLSTGKIGVKRFLR
ncbi:chemotaxis protein CheD [Iodobacter arcticus]|uniref:Probable chemoreceptor glutamine deamidase CheD n=1 Tax=Iodobacter arcticus TaxID=590593 RepID=A0ABW2R086_9NEIS